MTKQFKWDYKKHQSKHVDVDLLDGVAETVFTSNNPASKVWAMIKLVLFFVYIIARKVLLDEKMNIAKQQFEQDTVAATDEALPTVGELNDIHTPPQG